MRISFFAVLAILVLTFTATGCKRLFCCGYPSSIYICTKGSDTTYFAVTGPSGNMQNLINDSLNMYAGKGFVCALFIQSNVNPGGPNCIWGEQKRKALASGMNCDEAVGDSGGGSCDCY